MTTFVKILFLVVVFFSPSMGMLSAQSHYYYCAIAHPVNQEEILNEVLTCYADRIQIDENSIAAFLSEGGDAWYDATMSVPGGFTFEKNGATIFFDWEDMAGRVQYQVRSLNLKTGEILSARIEISEIGFPRKGVEYWLTAFSTITENEGQIQKSADYIIIDEKPILAPIITDGLEQEAGFDCACTESGIEPEPLGKRDAPNGSGSKPRRSLQQLKVYPNPNPGEFQIHYTLSMTQEVAISLVDVMGNIQRIVQPPILQKIGKHQLSLNVTDLPGGLYYCLLNTENGLKYIKFLKW